MQKLDKIRAKITALLKKNSENGATESEANAAMMIAARLMDEHGITMNDIKNNTEAARDFVKTAAGEKSGTLHPIDQFVVTSIAAYTDTKVWNAKSWGKVGPTGRQNTESIVTFYGYSVDVELALYIREICKTAMETEWWKFAEKLPQGSRRSQRKSFMIGMALRLRDRLQELKEENTVKGNSTDLVVLKNQLVEISFKEDLKVNFAKQTNKSVSYYAGNAFKAGKEAAENVRFNRSVYEGPQGGVKLIA